jgi:hypothetical protein
MATAKTSSFILSERLTATTSGTATTATIDLGAYVDVADRQAIAVEKVDFILQGITPGQEIDNYLTDPTQVFAQVTDLNRGGVIVFADDRALVGSGIWTLDESEGITHDSDMIPDNYGPSSAQGSRLVVNDQMYLTALANNIVAAQAVNVTVRITCKVVKLSNKDWMAIAIQSTAADN